MVEPKSNNKQINTNLATNMQLTCKNAKTMALDAINIKL